MATARVWQRTGSCGPGVLFVPCPNVRGVRSVPHCPESTMFTTATKAPAREPVAITDRRHLGVAAMSAIAIVLGLAVWFLATTMGYAGENTGAMVGILVASVGLTF